MPKIELLTQGVDVQSVYWALQSHPELWNRNPGRTQDPDSPHHGLDDIWVRYGEPERRVDGKPHQAHWYEAADAIEGLKKLCLDIMRYADGVELGGVLITRIPAGKTCRPHVDGGWHALAYEKYALQIASAPGQKFCFESEALETKPGDVFWFNNQHLHWVENPTPYERVTLIVCVRKES